MREYVSRESVTQDETESDVIPPTAALLFIPLNKRAFGAAVGVATAILLVGATIGAIATGDANTVVGLTLLSNYFAGYSVTVAGALIGALWAFTLGFIVGWLIAFTRNLTLAVSLFLLKSRAELAETSDFLDRI
jgi:hypothetical protein